MTDDDTISAYHESGHCIVGTAIGVCPTYTTIEGKPHTAISLRGIIRIGLSDGHRAVFFLAGTVIEQYYFPDVPTYNRKDEVVLWGLPERRRIRYEAYILQLMDDTVRSNIESLADRLLREKTIRF
jgi:hypothetical protein